MSIWHCGDLFHQETCFPQSLCAFQVFSCPESDGVSPSLADVATAYLDLVTCVTETVDGVVLSTWIDFDALVSKLHACGLLGSSSCTIDSETARESVSEI